MGRKYFSVSEKLYIFSAAELSGNILGMVRVNNLQPNKIRQWRTGNVKLIEKNKKNCKAFTMHSITMVRFNLERISKPDYQKFIQTIWIYK